MSKQGEDPDGVRDHLKDVEDGCGCAEVWEHAAAHREESERAAVEAAVDDD